MTNNTIAMTATTAKTPKQFTCGISESLKNTITEFRKDFHRPAAVAKATPVAMTEKEALECLYTVATNRRFQVVPVMETVEVDGENITVQVHDVDGNPVFETVEKEWEAIKARDYGTGANGDAAEKIMKSIRRLMVAQGKSEKEIDTLLAALVAAEA
jgi:hypothetical protein